MSIKTLRKRIALVATVSLGFGLLSVAPAIAGSAAVGDLDTWTVAAKAGASDTTIVVGTVTVGSAKAATTDEGASVTIYTRAASIAITDLSITARLAAATDTATLSMKAGTDVQAGVGTRISASLTATARIITWVPSASDATKTLTTLTAGSSYTVWNEIATAGRGAGEG